MPRGVTMAPVRLSPDTNDLPLAQVLSAFSYALDLTEGQPPSHCIRACWIGGMFDNTGFAAFLRA